MQLGHRGAGCSRMYLWFATTKQSHHHHHHHHLRERERERERAREKQQQKQQNRIIRQKEKKKKKRKKSSNNKEQQNKNKNKTTTATKRSHTQSYEMHEYVSVQLHVPDDPKELSRRTVQQEQQAALCWMLVVRVAALPGHQESAQLHLLPHLPAAGPHDG